MEPFQHTLPNGGTVTGLCSIPLKSATTPKFRPLIIGLHGGGYDCRYFDAHANYTAATASQAFSIPFISLNRPCYGGTFSFLPLPPNSDFCTESARWLHEQIFPLLWEKYGQPDSCTCIILLCHSLGVQVGVPTAAMHALDKTPLYPLGGIICSGLGYIQHAEAAITTGPWSKANHRPEHILSDVQGINDVMLPDGTADEAVLQLAEQLNVPMPLSEVEAMVDVWIPTWRERWAKDVKVPVMFSLAGKDKFYEPTQEHLDGCKRAFVKSPWVEGSVVSGAPHCTELSYWSQGWYAQCFGFAMMCAASYSTR